MPGALLVGSPLQRLAQSRQPLRLLTEFAYLKISEAIEKVSLCARVARSRDATFEHLRKAAGIAYPHDETIEGREHPGLIAHSFGRRLIRVRGPLWIVESLLRDTTETRK